MQPRFDQLTTMNKTEAAYAQHLGLLKVAGEVVAFHFEGLKLRLAQTTFYTPDFLVVTPTHFEFHEVKGFWRDDARVKIKVAADKYPWFTFVAVQKRPKKHGGGWDVEVISRGG